MYRRVPLNILRASVVLCFPLTALAATNDDVEQLRQQMQDLQQRYEAQNATLRSMAARLQQIEAGKGGQPRYVKTGGATSNAPVGEEAGSPDAAGAARGTAQAAAGEEKVVREAPAARSAEAILLEQRALFQQTFSIEPGISYSHTDRRDLSLNGFLALDAIFLGNINLDRIKSDTFTADVTARYGPTDRLQFDVNIPYLYRDTNFASGGAAGGAAGVTSDHSVTDNDIGDISAGVYYSLFQESPGNPDTVISLRAKAPTGKDPYGIKLKQDPSNTNLYYPTELPTGNGVWALTAGISFIRSLDPAVVFANLGYTYNIIESFNDISSTPGTQTSAKVDLGNHYTLGAGIAFALNERMSLSMSYSQRITDTVRIKEKGQSWQDVSGSDTNSGALNFGVTYGLTDKLSALTSVAMGVTPDAPDVVVGIRFPYRF
ncbi:MAG TPA: hypothetical protein PKW44_06695 [Methylophilaceae bacterium]|nr:hypothetical protein [Methylophilaceae bacterium]HQR59964.1 hypothetical protein [Methylophilaceae bacterium]